jgi:hypothetical protein
MEGASLLEQRPRSVVVSQYSRERYAIRTPEWKLIREAATGVVALYRATDQRDRHDVAEKNPAVVSTLSAALDRWLESHRGAAPEGAPVELTSEDWRELESLGYLR